VQLRVVLLCLVVLALGLNSQQPTRVGIEQIGSDPVMQVWPWAPPTAKSGCAVPAFSIDEQYRVYLCAPDRNYLKPGHTPYLWVRLVPDPTFVPAGYLP